MSFPDYDVRADDHRSVLILVKPIGDNISPNSFSKIFEKIKAVQNLRIRDSSTSRCISFKYEKEYPPENNAWGDFQTHRKVLGLITIGKCGSEEKVEELSKEHIILQEKYQNTVYDSRCFVFNNDSSSSSESNDSIKFSLENKTMSPECMHSPVIDNLNDVFKNYVEPVPKSHMENEDTHLFNLSNSPKSDNSDSASQDIIPVSNFSDFNSLPNASPTQSSNLSSENFKVNDGGSGDTGLGNSNSSSTVKTDSSSPVFLNNGEAPSSKKIIISSNSNSISTHCIVYPDTESCDQLEHDVKEFANSIFWILESKRMDRSFEKQDKIPLLTAPFEKKNFVGIDTDTKIYRKRCLGRMKKHIGDLALQAGLPVEAFTLYSASVEYLKSGQDWLWLAANFEGQCAASHILQTQTKGVSERTFTSDTFKLRFPKAKIAASQSKSLPVYLDAVECKNLGKSMLSFEEIAEKYEEAISHYEKYHAAIIVEMECSMKASRVFITYEKYLEATKVLQNVVFTNLIQSDDEKLIRFNAVAQVFSDMGFYRKAAFFKRIAAMRCVSITNPNPNWKKCYYLMIESLDGFCLPLDVEEFPMDITLGWPYIQIHMLFDICSVSKMMNNQAITVRHLTFLLQTLLRHLAVDELQEVCRELEKLTAKCEGAPIPLILENGVAIPPVNLLNLPRVKSFKLQNLAPHLRPVKMAVNELKVNSESDSIFIFSPIPRDRDRSTKDFKWVQGDVCEVVLQVFNPLPFELKVTHMGILADDIPFESFPACLSLPAESGPYPVTLLGTPLGCGKLQILGYTTHVMGVKSNCRLKDITSVKKACFTIDVIPRLPLIHLTTSLPKASTFSSLEDTSYVVISAAATMYSGESQECTITISNTGNELVEWIDISLHSKLKKDVESSFFSWSKDNLNTQLPIPSGSTASFTLYINAIGDFINSAAKLEVEKFRSSSSTSNTPVRRKTPAVSSPEPFSPKIVEAVLQLQYSGGPGKQAGYCRQCAIAFTIEVLPSIVITKWDVLPSEIPTHCYLVFDIQNATSSEMEVLYALNKRILIEAHDICRVPVPVERCPLTAMSESFGEVWASVDICGHLWKYLDDRTDHRKAKLLTACRKHLENLVDLQWTLSALDIAGRASISDVTWTDDMLGFILMSPIRWDIQVNGRECKPEFEVNFLVGDLISFNIKLLNVSDVSLLNLNLFVRGYQDHQNSQKNYRIETKRAVIGRDRLHIDEIKPYEEFSHECGFIFFHSGLYKVDILCSHNDPLMLQTQSLLELDNDSIASIKGRKTKISPAEKKKKDPCLIQKCSPTIDVTILED